WTTRRSSTASTSTATHSEKPLAGPSRPETAAVLPVCLRAGLSPVGPSPERQAEKGGGEGPDRLDLVGELVPGVQPDQTDGGVGAAPAREGRRTDDAVTATDEDEGGHRNARGGVGASHVLVETVADREFHTMGVVEGREGAEPPPLGQLGF